MNSYAAAGEIIARAVDDLVAVGVSMDAIKGHVRGLEIASVESIAENSRDQLLLDFSYRTKDLAERFGKSPRTIQNWRNDAIKRKFISDTASAAA